MSYRHAATAGTLVPLAFGLLGLTAWGTGLLRLASVRTEFIPMAPSTAVACVLVSAALTALAFGPQTTIRNSVRAVAWLVSTLALIELIEFFAGVHVIDWETTLFGQPGRFGAVPLARMSPLASATFVMVGLGLWCLTIARSRAIRDLGGVLGSLAVLIGSAVALGYAYGAPLLYGGEVIPMALTTGLAFIGTGVALVALAGPTSLPLRPFAAIAERANRAETDRRRAETELRLTARRFRALVENGLDFVSLLAADGTLLWENPGAIRPLGYAPDAFLGHNLFELVHPDDADQVRQALSQVMWDPASPQQGVFRLRRSDGSWCWVEASAANRLHDESVRAIVINYRDITERKRADDEIRLRVQQAAFAADVATALTAGEDLHAALSSSAEAMVRHLGAAVAQVWLVNDAQTALDLAASAGLDLHPGKLPAPVPVGQFKIGRIAAERQPHVSNDLAHDREFRDASWAVENGLVSFAGHPLVVHDRVIGVTTVLSPHALSDSTVQALASVAQTIALGVARRQLDDARGRLAAILEATPDFVTIGRIGGPPLFVNRAARTAFGLGPAEPVESLIAFQPPGFETFFERVVLPAAERDGSWSGETEYVSRGGRVIPVSQVSIVHRDSGGKITLISTMSRDITEQKRAAETLRALEERMRFALETSGVGTWDLDVTTGVFRCSTILESQLGLQPGTFAGTVEALVDNVHTLDRDGVRDAIAQAFQTGASFSVTYRVLWPDGTVRWLNSIGRIYPDARGVPARGAGISMDVTDRHTLEAQFRQAQKLEGVGQLAAGVAHDFNNLLTVINGMSDLVLQQVRNDESLYADVQEIQRAGERAAVLTRQLLAFSRQQVLAPRVVDFNSVIAGMESLLRRVLRQNINLAVVLTPGVGAVKVDPGQIEQVVMNLGVNARDAMPQGGHLTIETQNLTLDEDGARQAGVAVPPGSYVSLTVTDSGTGMDEATRARVFEPFFTTKALGKGTGLGLSTVHGIVTQSHGFIGVESEVGHGARFRIYLPLVIEPAVIDKPEPTTLSSSGTETILLVEDHDELRKLTARILEPAGYTVLAAPSAEEALRLLEHGGKPVDLLLSDVVLTGMSGRHLADRLAQTYPKMRVLYMSGHTSDSVLLHGVLEEKMHFLNKPYTASVLLRKVRAVLDS